MLGEIYSRLQILIALKLITNAMVTASSTAFNLLEKRKGKGGGGWLTYNAAPWSLHGRHRGAVIACIVIGCLIGAVGIFWYSLKLSVCISDRRSKKQREREETDALTNGRAYGDILLHDMESQEYGAQITSGADRKG